MYISDDQQNTASLVKSKKRLLAKQYKLSINLNKFMIHNTYITGQMLL